MFSNIGFQEIALIGLIVLILFGPKGISSIMRDLGRWTGALKRYRDDFTREMMALSETEPTEEERKGNERARIRTQCGKAVIDMPPEKRKTDNARIVLSMLSLPEYRNASSLFCFLSLPDEVNTFPVIEHALSQGKRLFVPFCRVKECEIGVVELTNPEQDLVQGAFGVPEPREALRGATVDSMIIDFFIIPGTAFDHDRNRLGKGKGYFDRFLKDVKGKRPIAALAFDEQLYPYTIPHYPHDIKPDMVITPSEIIREIPHA